MKKQIRKVGFAALLSMMSVAGASAATGHLTSGVDLCALIAEFQGIFKLLRTLAFVGAGFIIAKWGWEFISKSSDLKLDDAQKKGISMLIGFILLFGIGTFLQVLSSTTGAEILGCITTGW